MNKYICIFSYLQLEHYYLQCFSVNKVQNEAKYLNS